MTLPLAQIVSALEAEGQLVEASEQSPTLTGVTDDSRRVVSGSLFCAIRGTADDGHRHVADAARRGASAALVTRRVKVSVPQVIVRDGRTAAALAAREWYGRPGDRLRLVAVTGTNGKTTTVQLLRHLLDGEAAVGSIGTLGVRDGRGEVVPDFGPLTTPGAVELQGALAALARRGATTVVMEASSHALHQRRLETLTLACAVYTNLTHDHLDYHADFDAYRAAKLGLSTLLGPDGIEVVNADDRAWDALPQRPERRRIRYGRAEDAEPRLERMAVQADGSKLTLRLDGRTLATRVPLIGGFNVTNAMAAAAAAWGLGVAADAIARRLEGAPQVPGRMERLMANDVLVLRDYAHTPDALERALEALRSVVEGRLVVLFGAGGDRDRRKRPRMGAIAARLADLAVVTSDNPRTEEPDAIIDEIEAGMGDVPHLRITDRREAIHRMVATLRKGDCLLLAGKGHETYQIIGTERYPFDEAEMVRAALRERAPA